MSDDRTVLHYSAFAATPDGGNPAGVVLDAVGMSDERMQQIAAEVGFSETAFLVGRQDDAEVPGAGDVVGFGDGRTAEDARIAEGAGSRRRYRVRYWSPAAEVPFCGHATVATSVALAERHGPQHVVFETAAGDVLLRSRVDEAGAVTVSFTSVEPIVRELGPDVLARLLALLTVRSADLDPRFPPKEAFAGNRHPIIVLRDRELFDRFGFAPADVAALMREQGWLGTVTVLHQTGPADFDARNLFPVGNITEDPATGSAAASTGAYLRELGWAGETVRISQGAHVGRPSLLTVTIPPRGGIVVSGGATRLT